MKEPMQRETQMPGWEGACRETIASEYERNRKRADDLDSALGQAADACHGIDDPARLHEIAGCRRSEAHMLALIADAIDDTAHEMERLPVAKETQE